MMMLFCGSNLHKLFVWEWLEEKKMFLNFRRSLYPYKNCLESGQSYTLNMQQWCFIFVLMIMSNSEKLRRDIELVCSFTSSEVLS